MPFQKGNKAAKGNNKARAFADMIRVATSANYKADRTKLRQIAETLTQMALSGDMQAIKEIGDRLDGKAAQTVDVTTRDESLGSLTLAELASRVNQLEEGNQLAAGETEQPTQVH